MRLSIDKRDKGYRFDLNKNKCVVYFNDEVFQRAVTADEEQGLIVAYVPDPKDGTKFRMNEERTGFLTEQLRGRVRIEVLGDDGSSLRDPKVKAEMDPEGNGVFILVYSKMQPGNIRRTLIQSKSFPDEQTMLLACEAYAGGAAEYCCDKHGDLFDPSDVAKAGYDAAKRLLASIKEIVWH